MTLTISWIVSLIPTGAGESISTKVGYVFARCSAKTGKVGENRIRRGKTMLANIYDDVFVESKCRKGSETSGKSSLHLVIMAEYAS